MFYIVIHFMARVKYDIQFGQRLYGFEGFEKLNWLIGVF